MNAQLLRALALNEVRLRLRRLSSLVALLAVAALGWAMITDPAGGMTLLAVNEARVLYTSSTLALGSASLGGLLFGLGGFFLVRGRIGEDLRSGTGSVIATTPVGNAAFLFSRWLGGVAYLVALIATFMVTMLACHALRGEGPIQLWVYLSTYGLLLLPTVFFTVSCAVLFDSWTPLMGKRGDILFFLLWVAQLSLSSQLGEDRSYAIPGSLVFDFPGVAMGMALLQATLHTSQVSLGIASFDAGRPVLTLPSNLWTGEAVLMRVTAAAFALVPLLPAAGLFHRFSPDRVKLRQSRQRRSPLEVLDGLLRPLSQGVQPLFRLASVLPAAAGQVVADVALTLTVAPSAILVLLLSVGVPLLLPVAKLGGALAVIVAFWGILVSDLSTRDYHAGTLDMTGAVRGGIARRYLRHLAAAFVLGMLFMGTIAARWTPVAPVRACALVAGVFALSAVATLLGRCSNTPRTFMALFLFALYVALSVTRVPMLDLVGFNGAATLGSASSLLAIGMAALMAGFAWSRHRMV